RQGCPGRAAAAVRAAVGAIVVTPYEVFMRSPGPEQSRPGLFVFARAAREELVTDEKKTHERQREIPVAMRRQTMTRLCKPHEERRLPYRSRVKRLR
ncbi:MAG: hypothetical protein ACKO6E_00910, partial [Planctomycetota bacterium]